MVAALPVRVRFWCCYCAWRYTVRSRGVARMPVCNWPGAAGEAHMPLTATRPPAHRRLWQVPVGWWVRGRSGSRGSAVGGAPRRCHPQVCMAPRPRVLHAIPPTGLALPLALLPSGSASGTRNSMCIAKRHASQGPSWWWIVQEYP